LIRGIYTAASGMMAQKIKQETIANNLSNLDTSGYKRDSSIFHSFPDMLLSSVDQGGSFPLRAQVGSLNLGILVEENFTLHTQGGLYATENPLDFALDGEGFFTVRTPDGIRYTRNGHFLRDVNGNLVTPQGYFVLGEREEPFMIPSEKVGVDKRGVITHEGERTGRFMLTVFENPETLRKEGNNLFAASPGSQVANVEGLNTGVSQGFLEGANIDLVEEISQAMMAMRVYEVNQKVLLAQDELLGKCVNEVGTLR